MEDDLSEAVKKCLDILEENVEILGNLEYDLNDENEDELTTDIQLHDLYDMAEEHLQNLKAKDPTNHRVFCLSSNKI